MDTEHRTDGTHGTNAAPGGGANGGEPTAEPAGATQELYPGQAVEVARAQRREAAILAANREPLPGPMGSAWLDVPQEVAGFTVRPLVHYDFVLLRKLNSPLLKQMAGEGDTTPFCDEEGYEMVLLFTTPVREAAALIMAQGGREKFRELALERIGYAVGPLDVALLVRAVEREFVRAFSTAIKYEPPAAEGGDGTVVFPPPPATLRTASAGGKSMSRASSTVIPRSRKGTSSTSCPACADGDFTTGP